MANPIGKQHRMKAVWKNILALDNHILGLIVCIFAIFDWLSVYNAIDSVAVYFSQGIYTVPFLSILSTFFSAIYLTLSAIILLSLNQPLSRFETVIPNLISLLAAFGVYLFAYVPSGNLLKVHIAVSLGLIMSGSIIVILSLISLRQAFSVTPQARFLVRTGPYAFVRHPMYIGNILSILGLALLIDSIEAMILFILCSGLQIWRAICEERLLSAHFPEYTEYRTRVGTFMPNLRFKRFALVALCTPLLPLSGRAGEGMSALGHFDAPHTYIDRIKAGPTAKQCTDWSKKAAAGGLFTANELVGMDLADPSVPACKTFLELQQKCQEIAGRWSDNDIGDGDFVKEIEAARGCRSLFATEVCKALKNIARSGVRLNEDRQAFIGECLKVEVISKRYEQIRPGM